MTTPSDSRPGPGQSTGGRKDRGAPEGADYERQPAPQAAWASRKLNGHSRVSRARPRRLVAISADNIWAEEPLTTTSRGSVSITRRTHPYQPRDHLHLIEEQARPEPIRRSSSRLIQGRPERSMPGLARRSLSSCQSRLVLPLRRMPITASTLPARRRAMPSTSFCRSKCRRLSSIATT